MDDTAFDAEEIAAREFPVSFRGYSQQEVRAFLDEVAADAARAREREQELRAQVAQAEARAATRPLSDEEFEQALGREAGQVIHAAREAAAEIRARAEEQVARLVRDASGEGSRAQQEAESLLARRSQEAEQAAAAIRAEAQAEADELISQAKAEGREMVAEAQAVRERVLKDLARRRRLAHQHLEQLRAGRERLLEAYRLVRSTLDEATQELTVAESEARAAAERAALRAASQPEMTVEELEAEVAGARDIGLASPAGVSFAGIERAGNGTGGPVAPLASPSPWSEPAAPRPEAEAEAAAEPDPEPAAEPEALAEPEPAAEPEALAEPEPAAEPEALVQPELAAEFEVLAEPEPAVEPEPEPQWRPAPPEAAEPESAEPEPQPEPADPEAEADPQSQAPEAPAPSGEGERQAAPSVDERAGPEETTRPVVGAEPQPAVGTERLSSLADARAEVEEIFARLRAEQATAPVAEAPSPEPGGPGAGGDGPDPAGTAAGSSAPAGPAGDDEVVLQGRDADIEVAERTLVRALKRALADEQNEVLDTLRRTGSGVSLDDLLPAPSEHTARYLAVARPELVAGAASGAGAGAEAPSVDDLAVDLAATVAGDLRERLQRALERSGGDEWPLVEGISAAYREWKTSRVEPLARHLVAAAHTRGRFSTCGERVRWVVDAEEGPCPDCDDNALAGAIPAGEPFPTGQLHPPAHIGCRCTVAGQPGA